MNLPDTDDPYSYGATWFLKGSAESCRFLGLIEDPDGITAGHEAGEVFVLVTWKAPVVHMTFTIAKFLACFTRSDGTAPQPVIPAQRAGD